MSCEMIKVLSLDMGRFSSISRCLEKRGRLYSLNNCIVHIITFAMADCGYLMLVKMQEVIFTLKCFKNRYSDLAAHEITHA